MACRTNIAKPRRKVCVGDLSDRVTLQARSIAAPGFGDPDFGEDFGEAPARWARVRTVTGKTLFDGATGTDREVTHEIVVRYDPCVTSETWALFEGRRLDVLAVEDLEERHEYLLLTCAETGRKTSEAAKA